MAITAANAYDIRDDLEAALVAALGESPYFRTGTTDAGDTASQVSNWSISGATAANTNAGTLYWTLEDASGVRTVKLWKAYPTAPTITNAGFEAGTLTGWSASDPAGAYVNEASSTRAYSGTWSARHYYNIAGVYPISHTSLSLAASATYRITAWVWVVSGTAILEFAKSTGSPYYTASSTTTGAWEKLSVTYTVPAGDAHTCNVLLRGACDAYFDDISIAVTTSADLVASGTRTGDGVVTLAEANSSGLSGSVTVAYTTDDTDASNTLSVPYGTINSIIERSIASDDLNVWMDMAPLLVVSVGDVRTDRNAGTFGTYAAVAECEIEWRASYADLAAGRDEAQRIADQLGRWLVDEEHTAGRRINGYMDTADWYVIDAQTTVREFELEDDTGAFVISCALGFTLNLNVSL